MAERLLVVYRMGARGLCYSNLLWTPNKWPERWNGFPKEHPCHANPNPVVWSRVAPTDDPLGRFRGRGYYASCFPEGDGIAFEPPDGKTDVDVIRDVEECFGFEVRHG